MRCEGLWWQNVGISNGLTHRTYYFRRVRMQLMMRKVCGRPTNAAVDQWREQQAGGAEVNTHTHTNTDTNLCSYTRLLPEEESSEGQRDSTAFFVCLCMCACACWGVVIIK